MLPTQTPLLFLLMERIAHQTNQEQCNDDWFHSTAIPSVYNAMMDRAPPLCQIDTAFDTHTVTWPKYSFPAIVPLTVRRRWRAP